ncbi:TIGR03084 family protein [Geodermatophilus sp. DF01-2]|uniref:TIGR03084 family metal-binding protein n=1 Tax=Geodermatophilus sp. DF01-2 TaxID=2559610 RepID=UPI0010736858|nr:TIGR03084 family metal-binding protein [Geodermatophilus sp. DF01_2]TFV55126.1 TIGR03084 family protein [Geodermatophilus sp. DF01_2]
MSAAALLQTLVDDLDAEAADLDARVAPLDGAAWLTPTPAAGWDIRDTVNHLRFFDRDALLAVTDPAGFTVMVTGLGADAGGYVDRLTEEGRADPPAAVLAAWRAGREALAGALRALEPGVRVPWFGPPMSPASFVTARLMETWAHGQDVVDALGQDRPATRRLCSVAEIGVRARPFSYAVRGMAVPEQPVRVELTGPDGELWTWGTEDADDVGDVVQGPALDFCLLVTQRRHRDDLSLEVTGPAAEEWMGIAQAFAGPPGTGREPLRGAAP